MKKSPSMARALRIIKSHAIMSATHFGQTMWPTSPSWHRISKSGHGVTRGAGIRLAAGAYLAKLQKKGYISNIYPLMLTKVGEAVLGELEAT